MNIMNIMDTYNGMWYGKWSCVRCNHDWVCGDVDPLPCPKCGKVDRVVKVWRKKPLSQIRRETKAEECGVDREEERRRKKAAKLIAAKPVYLKPQPKNNKPVTMKELRSFQTAYAAGLIKKTKPKEEHE